jgi:CYTH domain
MFNFLDKNASQRYWVSLALALIFVLVSVNGLGLVCAAPLKTSEDFSDAAEGIMENDDAEGTDVARIENEYKLSVPDKSVEKVWTYLKTRYDNKTLYLKKISPGFKSQFSTEYFIDTYFDDTDLSLLKQQCGIRHRRRDFPDDPGNRKDGRQLMQIKLNRPDDLITNRTEYKYPIVVPERIRTADDRHPVIGIIKRKKRKEFIERVQSIGLDAYALQPIFTLNQKRQRVYLTLDEKPFATITLDTVSSDKWWTHIEYTEIEMELNEINYTKASGEARKRMQAVNDDIKTDLLKRFPEIKQNQTPKYNKAFDRFEERYLLFKWAILLKFPVEVLLGLLLLLGGIGFYLFREHQRKESIN